MGKLVDFLQSVTRPETLSNAMEILRDTEEAPLEHAIRMSKAGQAWLVVDHLFIAILRGDVSEQQAALLLARAIENSIKWEKDANERRELEKQIVRLRTEGYLPPYAKPSLTEEEKRELDEFTRRVVEKLPQLEIWLEQNGDRCEARSWRKRLVENKPGTEGRTPICSYLNRERCHFPVSDESHCRIFRERNK